MDGGDIGAKSVFVAKITSKVDEKNCIWYKTDIVIKYKNFNGYSYKVIQDVIDFFVNIFKRISFVKKSYSRWNKADLTLIQL